MRGPELSRRALFTLAAAGAGAVVLAPPARAEQVTSIDVGGTPASVAVNPVTGFAYVSDPSTGVVSVLDSVSGTLSAVIPIGGRPGDLAVDPVTNRIYVANPPGGTVVVLDGLTHEVVSVLGAGIGASSVDVDEEANRIYAVSAATGTIAVLDGVSCTLRSLVPGPVPSLTGIAVDPGRKLAYCTSVGTNSVEIFDITAGRFTGSAKVGQSPTGVAVQRATGTVYVANSAIHHLSVVDSRTYAERKTILLRSEASAVTVHEGTNTVYTNGGPNGIAKIDGALGALSGELTLGINPGDLAVDQRTRAVYVTDPLHGRVSLIRDF
ncbi:YncE family protein [Amycolatopsis sp. H20-H5]|uniref:YncE family protein n=1 Tax=Amycolatopsis sp. H20-H5 TaxID=3046309 RepID=UPI002DBC71C2|nr:YncE family protein [Amycolatopsis sp. H20-H5]MEC3976522.1 YncE family protein [Amycolatopsis sp. H20-H5]